MLGTRLTCNVRSGSITGIIGGKALHCVMGRSQGGANLPSGEYQIVSPQNDVIFGTIALIVPAEKWGAPGALEATFVLSDRPILGRNSVIVQSGFADLMDALKVSGGATLQVL
jgi:hypothetical protein